MLREEWIQESERLTERFNAARGLIEEIESREKLASSEKKENVKDVMARATAVADERKKVMRERLAEAKEAQVQEAKQQGAMVDLITKLSEQITASEEREAQNAASFQKLVDFLTRDK